MENYFTSVRDALVCLIMTRLVFVIVAQIEMASPGTYPPRSNLNRVKFLNHEDIFY